MADFFKYLTVSEEDINWGLYLNVAGISEVSPNSSYPNPKHPSNYFFNWDEGRILDEYQLNYITSGSGIFETKAGKFRINPGTVLLLFPGVWHRYKPDVNSGWTEHYIGFSGAFTKTIFQHEQFNNSNPVLKVGFQDSLIKEFNDIFQLIKDEKPGFQQQCAGKLIFIFGRMISILKTSEFANKDIERIIRKSCLYLRDNLNKNVNIEELAASLHVSYSYFRRMFKKYTGMSPNQYHLGLRIQKSKELIRYSKKSIKQIAFELGFDSLFYFSRIFKTKEGLSPAAFRALKHE
ncbi:MAG: AraC family transcriptional regulator [Prolixibacteraceae bacterium]